MSKLLVKVLAAMTVLPSFALAAIEVPSGHYVLEPTHAYITFSYSHLGFSTPHVAFTEFEVDLQFDANKPEASTLNVSIDPSSVESRVDEFNEHLVGERFFDTANHPTITFKSTSIEFDGEHNAKVTGNLTIKGQSHPVSLNTTLNKAGNHPMLKKPMMGFNAEMTLPRSQWGLGYAIPMVGDDVNLFITVELMPAGE